MQVVFNVFPATSEEKFSRSLHTFYIIGQLFADKSIVLPDLAKLFSHVSQLLSNVTLLLTHVAVLFSNQSVIFSDQEPVPWFLNESSIIIVIEILWVALYSMKLSVLF